MKRLALFAAIVLLCAGCAGIPVERTYAVEYQDAAGRKVNAGVTLRPPPQPAPVTPAPVAP